MRLYAIYNIIKKLPLAYAYTGYTERCVKMTATDGRKNDSVFQNNGYCGPGQQRDSREENPNPLESRKNLEISWDL